MNTKKQKEELAAVEKHVSNPDESNPLEELVNPSNQEDISAPKNEASPQKKRGDKKEELMKMLFWNIREVGAGRRKQLVELCNWHDFKFFQ